MTYQIGKKYLITTDGWFFTPDGKSYCSVFGTIKDIANVQQVLGITPNSKSTNWYLTIGNLTIAGCQIHYALQTDICNCNRIDDEVIVDGEAKIFNRESRVYFAD